MADQTSKSRRWELGLRPHREELSSISTRTDNPEDQNKDNYNDIAETEEEDDDHHSATVVVVDYDLLVSEILSRLPAKSLMRCKCVCKAWKSTIEHDSHFINLHHTRSQAHPRFFIASFPPYRCRSGEGYDESSFFSADLHYNDGGIQASIDTVTRVPKSMHTDTAQRCLGPVRGLVCLIDAVFASQIRNVCTHQSTPWINSAAATVMYQKLTVWPRYQFGYDPNTGKHKVVYVWTGYKFKEDRFAEVLTVGDTRWRRVIDDVPQCEILGCHRSAYVNGCVYWLTGSAVDKSQSLLAFDIGSEKFRMIPIPSFASCPSPCPCLRVIEMDGCITLILRVECLESRISPELKLWKFRDDHDKEEWTEEDSIIIPSCISKNMGDIFFHPIPGKDQMILEIEYGYGEFVVEIRRNRRRNAWDRRFYYSYDMRKKTFSKFETRGIPHVPFSCYTPCASYVESIFPVE
ncbi:Putative F-box protein At5g52610 [Linum perenne]